MHAEVIDRLADLDAAAWNRLHGGYPFLTHEFLSTAEESGCVSPRTGWEPRHIALFDRVGLAGAMPLYRKHHSWGEFVFDWDWAHAYQGAGLAYYPKLVSAAPFTPAGSRRLLTRPGCLRDLGPRLVERALELARDEDLSSLHVQFPHGDELPVLRAAGLKLRKDCQFHWHNRGYRSFDDFLAGFSSRKRKKARRDRRHVAEQGIRFRWLQGDDLTASIWEQAHRLISNTFLRRGSTPYFTLDFFLALGGARPQEVLVVLAERRRRPLAAAVFLVGRHTLYGRYWGSDAHYNALHFETCYYQGIEFCIARGLSRFEPGTQGEHKVSRGFTPVSTWSAHWLAHPAFFDAVGRYLDQEGSWVDHYIDAVDAHTPYRRSAGGRVR